MKVLISGATGLIGSALMNYWRAEGHQVAGLQRVRGEVHSYQEPCYNLDQYQVNPAQFHDCDVIVHLAGESIASGRWTQKKKTRIINSRVNSTKLLVAAVIKEKITPKVFICASAIGFYGDRGDLWLDEQSSRGDDFVSEVAMQWELACEPLKDKKVRLVNLRTGLVLSRDGGALKQMLLPFSIGLGGMIGNGKQYMSWISITDVVAAIDFITQQPNATGPINLVAPEVVTNRQFTKALGRVLRRPTVFTLPSSIVRLLLGEMARELLLSSTRVKPQQLISLGFIFRHTRIDDALANLLSDLLSDPLR